MEIQNNSRQMPKTREYLSNKLYYDVLYAYLQVISQWDGVKGHPRYIQKKDAMFTKIARNLGKSRQTIAKKFKQLQELGLVLERANGDFELVILQPDVAELIPFKTLRIMANVFNDNAISAFIYLFNRYIANNYSPYIFTYEQLKSVIGISAQTRSNDYIIQDILLIMQKVGLIDLELKNIQDENTGEFKSIFYVKKVCNEVNEDGIELKF